MIIEMVSGQSYDEFMTEHILLPLGLNNTFTLPQNAFDTGRVIYGHRRSFFRLQTANAVFLGNVPSGYIYSTVQDMSLWLQIQMGAVEVSEQFERIIRKSHQPNLANSAGHNRYSAAGWFIDNETGQISHSGLTEGFSTYAAFRPESNIATIVLTNLTLDANTVNIGNNVLNILDGSDILPYRLALWPLLDRIFAPLTLLIVAGYVMLVLTAIRMKRQIRDGQRERLNITPKRLIYFVPPVVMALLIILSTVIFPLPFDLLGTAPDSLFTAIALTCALPIFIFPVSLFSAISKKL